MWGGGARLVTKYVSRSVGGEDLDGTNGLDVYEATMKLGHGQLQMIASAQKSRGLEDCDMQV